MLLCRLTKWQRNNCRGMHEIQWAQVTVSKQYREHAFRKPPSTTMDGGWTVQFIPRKGYTRDVTNPLFSESDQNIQVTWRSTWTSRKTKMAVDAEPRFECHFSLSCRFLAAIFYKNWNLNHVNRISIAKIWISTLLILSKINLQSSNRAWRVWCCSSWSVRADDFINASSHKDCRWAVHWMWASCTPENELSGHTGWSVIFFAENYILSWTQCSV